MPEAQNSEYSALGVKDWCHCRFLFQPSNKTDFTCLITQSWPASDYQMLLLLGQNEALEQHWPFMDTLD